MDHIKDKMPLSPDHNEERLAKLKELMPDIFTNEGKLNINELKKVVNPELVNETERYEFRWFGKSKAKREAFTPTDATLVYDKDRSVNPENAQNIIIEGENLAVLKLLSKSYREKVKCIYIDPPYNTGKDFVYTDKWNQDKAEYWEDAEYVENGMKVDTNMESDGRFHSNWLNMMYSRLLIARQVLRADGVIFISIDDNEVHHLRKLCDIVFGEDNFAGMFIIKATPNARNYGNIGKMHEYAVMYAKDLNKVVTYELEEEEKEFKYEDDIGGFNLHPLYNSDESFHVGNRKNLYYPIYIDPDSKDENGFFSISVKKTESHTQDVYPPLSAKNKVQFVWRWSKDKARENVNKEIIGHSTSGGEFRVSRKMRHTSKIVRSMLLDKNVSGRHGTAELENLMQKKVFSFPKPVHLIKTFINVGMDRDDIILDFFAGSGSTVQAILESNVQQNYNRKLIAIQLPEATDSKSEAYKAGYKKISDITIERNKRVIEKIIEEKKAEQPGLFTDDKKEDSLKGLGFKVFKLQKSNFPRTEFAPDPDKTEEENVELLKKHIRDKEAQMVTAFNKDELITEILIKKGYELNYTTIKKEEFKKNEIFHVTDGLKETLICLDGSLDKETVEYFKQHPEEKLIVLERALDTTKKWNLKHYMGDNFVAF